MRVLWKFALFWLLIALGITFLQSPVLKCWIDGGSSLIKSMCKTEEVVGNKCSVVCSALETECYLHHASKILVRVIKGEDEAMVFKLRDSPMLTKGYTQSLLDFDGEDEPQKLFQDLLRGLVTFELNRKHKEDILSLLWPWQNLSFPITGDSRPVMEQILRFAHNDEYKLMQLHSDLGLFPAVLGTCGDVYVVEHATPLLSRPLLDLLPAFTDTCHAVRSAARILDYLAHLSAALPLHLCDLQWDHFGAAADGRLRFLDLDAAFSADKMAATQRGTACSDDADCDFFDCRGTCDTTAGHCHSAVSDNVSNLCRQLVWARAPLLGAERRLGLLAAVLDGPQAELLERCARSRDARHAQQVAHVLDELERRLC